ncbi:hypothetical protein [Colwellia echini]|uniref:Early transcribed membrane protein n=1 Tax=Colwellia echini TaxID=1982103 RepID=A0ABY3MT37_9GAMM|nr:hypothetical protein [Colwellia echini]TYK64349.1 hypothetical protein CWS31_016155 [Colwellia echini]
MIKSVISTFSVTMVSLLLIGKLFFSSLLGVFGYAALPIAELSKLKASQQVVDKLKTNHKAKKTKTTTKFAKRTGKKVGAIAISAATIGTVAVIGTLTYIELNEYCEEKRELINEENILYNTNLTFDFNICMEQAKSESSLIADEAWSTVKASSTEVIDNINGFLKPSREELSRLFEKIDKYFAE